MAKHSKEDSNSSITFFIIMVIIALVIGGIFWIKNNTTSISNNTTSILNSDKTETKITAKEITDKLKEKIPSIENIVVYNEENDPNNLLGRPNSYISKTAFKDNRISHYPEDKENFEKYLNTLSEEEKKEQLEELIPEIGTVEVFNNEKDLKTRKEYLEAMSSGTGLFTQYIYANGCVLLRLFSEATPTQAKEYENVFNTIMNSK